MKLTDLDISGPKVTQEKKQESFLTKEIDLFPHRVSDKEKETIYRQLNVLQQSGVDIRASFEILFQQLKRKKTREKLQMVLAEIVKGKSLSESLAQFKDFTPYEVFSLKIGEETGRLTLVFEKLTTYFENQIAQRRQIVSALSYPILITLTSFGAVSFMIFFIIPMFEEVFLRFNSDLPALTKTIIGLSRGFRSNALLLFSSVGIVLFSIYALRKNLRFRWFKEWIWLRVPLWGEIYRQIYLARFCDSMGLLILSAVPMVHTLEMVRKMIGFLHIEVVLDQIKTDLVQGKTITEAFEKHAVFDNQMIALIKVGEEVNQLGSFFQKLSLDYTNSVKHKTALMATFLEPFMIIFLGLVVGVILVAMYLPMFELSSSMDFGN
ncbi:type II secretion system F family protein [Marinoscillum sp. 108]|uniref:type II secretion system F family protein n=1 Tax=Marinoscillum sp. 108 TaxID=2653151 RepID=UPI0012F383EC|nr:type II secretion system F family protein [Marinoscillum sp. 108]VXD14791.1 General secretion pathway protein GspF [Marinoscillum sp. 108]